MADPFIGEIRMFGFNFAPVGWALCNGQLLSIAQNSALFSLLGTQYGGDGRSTFGLPDLQGRVPIHYGQGAGLSSYQVGQKDGHETVTLSAAQMPVHTHQVQATTTAGDTDNPAGSVLASGSGVGTYLAAGANQTGPSTTSAGGGQAVSVMQPYQVVNFCIALQGIYPSRY